MSSVLPNRFLPPTTMDEIVKTIGQELSDTYGGLTKTMKRVVLSRVDKDKERVELLKAKSKHAYSRLTPIFKLFRLLTKSMVEVDYESAQGKQAHVMLSESYMWASFCTIAYMIGGQFGVMGLMNFVLSPALHVINAFALGSFILPVYAHLYSRKTLRSDHKHRGFICRISFLIGFLLAYVAGHPHSWTPPLFVLPLWIGLITCLRASDWGWVLGWRINYVVVATLSPLIIHVILTHYVYGGYAKATSWPCTVTWICVSSVAFLDLQLRLGRVTRGWSAANIEHCDTAMVFVLTQFWICSSVRLPFLHASGGLDSRFGKSL